MAKLYDIRAITGEYEKEGETKKRYQTIGAVLETKSGGQMIKLDVIPMKWDGFAYLNEPYKDDFDKKEHQDQHNFNKASRDVVIDDIDDKPIDLSGVEIPF